MFVVHFSETFVFNVYQYFFRNKFSPLNVNSEVLHETVYENQNSK